MAGKKKKKNDAPVHEELKGLHIEINALGEITSNIDISDINRFLDKHTDDKKLRSREKAGNVLKPGEEEE